MGTFEITAARQELGFTPSTSVRGNVQVPLINEGSAIGAAVIAGAEIYKRREQMQDGNSAVEANRIRALADQNFETYKENNNQSLWRNQFDKSAADTAELINKLPLSQKALEKQQLLSKNYSTLGSAKALTDATRQLRKETITIQTTALEEAYAKWPAGSEEIAAQEKLYRDSFKSFGVDEEIIEMGIAAARAEGAPKRLKAHVEVRAFTIAAEKGYEAAEQMLRDPATTAQLISEGMKREDIRSLLNDISTRVKQEKVKIDEETEAQREIDRGDIYRGIHQGEIKLPDGTVVADIGDYIENSSLDEDEQEEMRQRLKKETDRKLKGEDIVTVGSVRSQFYKEIPLMLSGSVSRDELLNRANEARLGKMVDGKLTEPTLSDSDYKNIDMAINAQYEQGYGQMMSQVNKFAEGILLKTDSLGYVKNAPVRQKQMGDFQEAWLKFVASKGADLKLSEIYPEGRRLAATFQISDKEAGTREDAFNKELQKKEAPRKKLTPQIARRYLDITGNDREEAKRLAAEDGYAE